MGTVALHTCNDMTFYQQPRVVIEPCWLPWPNLKLQPLTAERCCWGQQLNAVTATMQGPVCELGVEFACAVSASVLKLCRIV